MKSIQINNIPKSQSLFNCKWHFYQNIPSENQFYTFIFPRALPPSIHHRLTAQETKVFGGIAIRKNINKIFGASQTVHPTVSWRRHAESDAVDRISVYICSNFVLFSSLATENSTKKGRKIPPQNPSTPRKKLELVPFEKFTQKDIPFAVHKHTDTQISIPCIDFSCMCARMWVYMHEHEIVVSPGTENLSRWRHPAWKWTIGKSFRREKFDFQYKNYQSCAVWSLQLQRLRRLQHVCMQLEVCSKNMYNIIPGKRNHSSWTRAELIFGIIELISLFNVEFSDFFRMFHQCINVHLELQIIPGIEFNKSFPSTKWRGQWKLAKQKSFPTLTGSCPK